MEKERSESNNGEESQVFCALLRRMRKSHKPDELLECPLFKRRLMTLCRLLTGNEWDAEDLYNDVCLKLCKVLHKFKPKYTKPYGRFFSWLGTVTRRTFFDRKRGLKLQFAIESFDDLAIADSEIDIEEQLVWNQRKSKLRGAISLLPRKKQLAVSLYIREGYSSRETAEMMATWGIKCTHATVANWVRQLLGSVFPEAKGSIVEPPRKPNARARRRPNSVPRSRKSDEANKDLTTVEVRKKTGKG